LHVKFVFVFIFTAVIAFIHPYSSMNVCLFVPMCSFLHYLSGLKILYSEIQLCFVIYFLTREKEEVLEGHRRG